MTNIYENIEFQIAEGELLKVIIAYEVKQLNKRKTLTLTLYFEVLSMKGKLNAKELTEFLVTELLQKRFCTLQSQSVKWKYLKISKGSQTFKYILANTYGTQQEEYYALEKCAVFEIQRQNKEVSSFVTLRGIPKSWLDGVNLPSFDLLEDVFIKSLVIENKLEICYIGSTSRNKRAKIISSTLKRDLQTKEIIKKPIKRKSY